MAEVISFYDKKKAKYIPTFPTGEVTIFKYFKEIVVENKLDTYLNRKLGKEWSYEKTKDQMLHSSLVQYLITWVSDDNDDEGFWEDYSIIMGLRYTEHERIEYKPYFKVVTCTRDISDYLDTFDEAYTMFNNTVYEFISGVAKK